MKQETAKEIMSMVLSEWDERFGIENCKPEVIEGTFKILLMSPHEDGLMPVSVFNDKEGINDVHLVPMVEIMLFGLKGEEVNEFPAKN